MNITFVNNTDLPGRAFNGYDLHISLNELNWHCLQLVFKKFSNQSSVIPILSNNESFVHTIISELESRFGVCNHFYPFAQKILKSTYVQNADIVHFHLLHNQMASVIDYAQMMRKAKSVWTIHDPWVVSGHCIHSLECEKWLTGCKDCPRLEDIFPVKGNNAHYLWEIKKEAYKEIDTDIVVASDFMLDYLHRSPLTSHFTRIHKIPFGINLDAISNLPKHVSKEKLGIPKDSFCLAFRDEIYTIKGVNFLIDAINLLRDKTNISIITVGNGHSLETIKKDTFCIELGWLDNKDKLDLFYSAADVFVMPSLAESFGLMAIEAMAHETVVICFNNTVLPEITHAPECGIGVEYKSSIALHDAILHMQADEDERKKRGLLGREIVAEIYRYSDYVKKHIELYQTIINRPS